MFEHSKQGAIDLLSWKSSLIEAEIHDIEPAMARYLGTGQPRIVLNMESIPLIDSAGLEWLLDVQDICEGRGGAMKLCRPSTLCREILHITEVDQRFDVFDDVVAALGSFAV